MSMLFLVIGTDTRDVVRVEGVFYYKSFNDDDNNTLLINNKVANICADILYKFTTEELS